MNNANVFDTEEKISLTKVAAALEKAGEACFTRKGGAVGWRLKYKNRL